MPREGKQAKRDRALEVARKMNEHYQQPDCMLHYQSPFTLTIAVLLSAQTTDAGVNRVTPELFEKYGTPEKMAHADPDDISRIIHSIGFYRTKAKNCIATAQMILSDFGGEVPQDINELQKLPGVGRKTANIVMNEAFGIVEGIAVDTHVYRIAHRLRFSNANSADKTEADLLKLYPKEYWGPINHQWVLFGREYCIARKPKCDICFVSDLCPTYQKQLQQAAKKAAQN